MTVRTYTRALVVVHSHIQKAPDNGVINLSNDVISITTSKPLKGRGHASLELVPRRNYFNHIYPNDVINLYFDPGDGDRGMVRTFFGYIDRIERSESTDDNGAVTTRFSLTCSDMTKALDETDIYFNPHLSNRKELIDPDFGLSALGGHSLRTRGITAHGTPADMVENLLQLLLGFGAQWVLPKSYTEGRATKYINANRDSRRQRAAARIPTDLASVVSEILGTDLDTLAKTPDAIQEAIDKQTNKQATGHIEFTDKDNQPLVDQYLRDQTDTSLLPISEFTKHRYRQLSKLLEQNAILAAFQTVAKDTLGKTTSIIDLISLSFIEAMAMDGYIASTAIWQQQGTLASLLYGYCNEPVNELFFDLRPTVADVPDDAFGTQYSREPDELGYNVDGFEREGFPGTEIKPSSPGIRYVPAVVMREYPFSVVEGLDLSEIATLDATLSFSAFGPVFAVDPSGESHDGQAPEPRRVIYDYEKEAGVSKLSNSVQFAENSAPLKHLDVFPISNQDVITSSIGRGDNDVFNLFALYANDSLMKIYKYLLQEFLPIISPVSVQRNGLRVFETNTKYAQNFQVDADLQEGEDQEEENARPKLDTAQIRRNLVRWSLLIDHWNQHNVEYLNGTITLRGMPDLRVGYRLDWVDRNESYYVENVSHTWSYPGPMTTTVQVSRGQRNDPFPAYIPPAVNKYFGAEFDSEDIPKIDEQKLKVVRSTHERLQGSFAEFSLAGGGNRSSSGRLGQFFEVRDTKATAHAVGGDARAAEDNKIDLPGEADHKGIAEYPGLGTKTKDLGATDWITLETKTIDWKERRKQRREAAKKRRSSRGKKGKAQK